MTHYERHGILMFLTAQWRGDRRGSRWWRALRKEDIKKQRNRNGARTVGTTAMFGICQSADNHRMMMT